MRVVCVQDFGLHRRGDVVEVPDDAVVSNQYYVPEHDLTDVPALAAPEAVGREAGPSEAAEGTTEGPPASPGDARREGEHEQSLFHPAAPGDRPEEASSAEAESGSPAPVDALKAELENLEGGK